MENGFEAATFDRFYILPCIKLNCFHAYAVICLSYCIALCLASSNLQAVYLQSPFAA